MKCFSLSLLLAVFFIPCNTAKSQSTYDQVYQLITTHCAGYACHGGGTPTFNITLPHDSFYHSIINATPVNPTAAGKFNKLVVPGDVQRSFLLRKMAHGISSGLALTQPAEGLDMPSGLPALQNNEIELVRQWILMGAPLAGEVVDTALINTFYRDGGITDTYSPHNPPAAGTGYQLYVGTIFMRPQTEKEYFIKYNPHLTTAIEVPQYSTMVPTITHHFVVYSFLQGHDQLFRDGLRPVEEGSMNDVSTGVGGFSGVTDLMLPPGSAFFYDQGTMMDVNIHMNNPAQQILATDLYVNFITQPVPTAQHYMTLTNYLNTDISIPQDNQDHLFTAFGYDSFATSYFHLWKLYSHTHKYGTGFNIWLRNPNGTKGAQIYDGNYDYEHDFMVGYYRWGSHSTSRTWPDDSLFRVDPRSGFIWEATFKNTAGPNPVTFGPTSADEMNIMGFVGYQDGDLETGINEAGNSKPTIRLFPNPAYDEFVLSYELNEPGKVQVDILNMLGDKVGNLLNTSTEATGKYTYSFNPADYHLAPGSYLVSFSLAGKTTTEKLIITD